MKTLILILIPFLGTSQLTFKTFVDRYKVSAPILFVSGMADGVKDATDFHYDAFKRVHPKANDQFWNNDISWKNKYDSDLPVSMTDGWHLMKRIDITLSIGGGVLHGALNSWDDLPTWQLILIDFVVLSAFRQAGKYLMYSVIYND